MIIQEDDIFDKVLDIYGQLEDKHKPVVKKKTKWHMKRI